MKHTWIPRILALGLVIAMIVVCILLANSGRECVHDNRLGENCQTTDYE